MKSLLVGMLLLVAAPVIAATGVVNAVKAQLLQPLVLRGEFEQSKQIQGFSKPLLSTGDFLVAREQGISWRTKTPFPGVLKLTSDEIVATQGDDVAFRLSASDEPSVRIINGLMFSLLNGDVAALEQQFAIDGDVASSPWKLRLTPKQAAFARLIRSIALQGDQHVREIVIDEANGDQTRIRFSAQSSEPPSLSADEQERLR